MIGRLDVRPGGPCGHCGGKGTDPKKRTRHCPVCYGFKRKLVCQACGEDMPCSGTDGSIFDQSHCNKGQTCEDAGVKPHIPSLAYFMEQADKDLDRE